jgi:hypothetical protein
MTIVLKFVVKREVLVWMKVFKVFVLAMFFPKHVNKLILTNFFLQESQVCFNQTYPIKFVEMYNLA